MFNKELPTNFSLVDLFSTNVQDNIIKKDTYIVFTESLFNNTEYLKNYCYKQREDKDYFLSQLDSKGDKYNGWGIISPLKKHKEYLYAWRYGTKEEGEEYERLQKPFDVTTLSNVSPEFITKKDINLLVTGEYYTCYKQGNINSAEKFIFKYNSGNNKQNIIGVSILLNTANESFYSQSSGINNVYYADYILKSTPEEINWLNACNKVGKYISKKEAFDKEYSPEISEISAMDINPCDEIVSGTVGYLNNGPKKSVPIIKTRNKEAKLMKVNAEVGQLLKTTTRTNKLFIIKI